MEEIWKDIEGYEGIYQVSNLGRVKTLYFRNNKYIIKKEKILKQHISKQGYLSVGLSDKQGKRKTYRVHRLVAQAFIPNPQKLFCVNHKDENKSNNIITNLEWTTTIENNRYSFNLHQERIKYMQTDDANRKRAEKKKKAVIQMNKENKKINVFEGVIDASIKTGFDKSTIANCCRGYYQFAYGYKWKYITREEFIRTFGKSFILD